MTYAYQVGELIEVWNSGRWTDAIVTSLAPQRNAPGYYMQYHPLPQTDPDTGIRPSTGGWTYEQCMRRKATH